MWMWNIVILFSPSLSLTRSNNFLQYLNIIHYRHIKSFHIKAVSNKEFFKFARHDKLGIYVYLCQCLFVYYVNLTNKFLRSRRIVQNRTDENFDNNIDHSKSKIFSFFKWKHSIIFFVIIKNVEQSWKKICSNNRKYSIVSLHVETTNRSNDSSSSRIQLFLVTQSIFSYENANTRHCNRNNGLTWWKLLRNTNYSVQYSGIMNNSLRQTWKKHMKDATFWH